MRVLVQSGPLLLLQPAPQFVVESATFVGLVNLTIRLRSEL